MSDIWTDAAPEGELTTSDPLGDTEVTLPEGWRFSASIYDKDTPDWLFLDHWVVSPTGQVGPRITFPTDASGHILVVRTQWSYPVPHAGESFEWEGPELIPEWTIPNSRRLPGPDGLSANKMKCNDGSIRDTDDEGLHGFAWGINWDFGARFSCGFNPYKRFWHVISVAPDDLVIDSPIEQPYLVRLKRGTVEVWGDLEECINVVRARWPSNFRMPEWNVPLRREPPLGKFEPRRKPLPAIACQKVHGELLKRNQQRMASL